MNLYRIKAVTLILLSCGLITGCSNRQSMMLDQETKSLKEKAEGINRDFRQIRIEVERLSRDIRQLYERQEEILPAIDKHKYVFASNGVFLKAKDDGGSAVFVSGFYPINEELKRIVYFTEPLDTAFRVLVSRYPEIVQVYFNDCHSLNRIYPFFDVLSQYEAKMDIPSFNFYYMADRNHNPSRQSLWLGEPYVDPAGRGWMVSTIAPVYFHDSLVGVPGIDVTINEIAKRYILENQQSMIIIMDNTGAIVTAQENAINLLSFPPLFEHKYIETIKQDTYRKETYNLALSKDERVRRLAVDIMQQKMERITTEINGEKLQVISVFIPEMNWYLLEIIR